MKGERRLAHLMKALRAVTPSYVRVEAGDVTVDFSDKTIRLLLNKKDERYRHRRTYHAVGVQFDIPNIYGGFLSSGDYDCSDKILNHVGEHVQTVIRQTRQAYTRVTSALAPEFGLRVLDGEKPEYTLPLFVKALLAKVPPTLVGMPAVHSFEMLYSYGNAYAVLLRWREGTWNTHWIESLPTAHALIQDLEGLLRWVLQVQATARAIRTARP